MYYILNTVTDESFDINEMEFYSSNWEPTLDDDEEWLQRIIDYDPIKFENCIIVEVTP